jgi:tetratricopeptide (TPR) repeat protein
LLLDEGNTRAARPHLERALASGERQLGPSHPHLATCLVNMGRLFEAEGDLAGARQFLERALAIREQALGADHPHTVAAVKRLQGLPLAAGN